MNFPKNWNYCHLSDCLSLHQNSCLMNYLKNCFLKGLSSCFLNCLSGKFHCLMEPAPNSSANYCSTNLSDMSSPMNCFRSFEVWHNGLSHCCSNQLTVVGCTDVLNRCCTTAAYWCGGGYRWAYTVVLSMMSTMVWYNRPEYWNCCSDLSIRFFASCLQHHYCLCHGFPTNGYHCYLKLRHSVGLHRC